MSTAKVFYATGRRKTSVARVFLTVSTDEQNKILVNQQPASKYFKSTKYLTPLQQTSTKFNVYSTIRGGGFNGQCDALSLGLSRALLQVDASLKKKLRQLGLITRDPRAVERKKPGRVKARKLQAFNRR